MGLKQDDDDSLSSDSGEHGDHRDDAMSDADS